MRNFTLAILFILAVMLALPQRAEAWNSSFRSRSIVIERQRVQRIQVQRVQQVVLQRQFISPIVVRQALAVDCCPSPIVALRSFVHPIYAAPIYAAPVYQPAPVQAPVVAPQVAPQPLTEDCCAAIIAELRLLRGEIAALRGK